MDESNQMDMEPMTPVSLKENQTFEIKTVNSGSETQQLISEYQRLAKFIPQLNYENSQEVEDLRVDLGILQLRIEQCIENSKKNNDPNHKTKATYLEKLHITISEQIDIMKKNRSSDESSNGSQGDIDIEETPKNNSTSHSEALKAANAITKRSFFIKEEKLTQPEDRQTEFKHYRYPFAKEGKAILLKTIVSLLNTQGGTIMIGVRDQDLSVVGINVDQKQKDEIILLIMQMLQTVVPAVNEEVTIDFIPIKFKWGKWASKTWICRIAVLQGQLDRFYYVEDTQVHSYVRYQAMCKSVKLQDIINFTYERAKHPRVLQDKIEYAAPDSDGVVHCNMEQDIINSLNEVDSKQLFDTKIVFTDISETSYQKFSNFLHEKLSNAEIDYQMINQRRHILLVFETNESTKRAIELLELTKDQSVFDLRHEFTFKKILMSDVVRSISVKSEFTFIIDHIENSKRKEFLEYLSQWLKSKAIEHVLLIFKLFIGLYVTDTQQVSEFLHANKLDIAQRFGFHQKVFFGFCKDHIILKNIDSKTELKKKLNNLLQYIPYRALVEKDGTTVNVKCGDFYDLLIAFDRIKSAYMDGQFSNFANHMKIKVYLGFDKYIE